MPRPKGTWHTIARPGRPSVTELRKKSEAEKHKTIRKLISGVGGFIGMTSAIASLATKEWWFSVLVMLAQTTFSYVDQRKAVENMKRENGLTYLFELDKKISTW